MTNEQSIPVYAYVALEGLRALRPRWRDLNLAARNAGIPDIMHDPETGEIGYEGQDLSIPALQFETPGLVPEMVLAHSEWKSERASAEKLKTAPGNPVAAKALPIPGSVQEQPVVKKKPRRRPGGVIW